MDILIQPLSILCILLVLNALVVVLYGLEYRRNKRYQELNKTLITTNQAILEQSQQTLATHKELLAQIQKETGDIHDNIANEKHIEELVSAAEKQANEITQSAVGFEKQFEATVASHEQENIQKVDQIVSKAIEDSQAIVANNAALKAQIDHKLKELFDQTLAASKTLITEKNETFITEYQAAMTKISNEYVSILQTTNKNIEDDFIKKTQEYLNEMKNHLIALSSEKQTVMEKEMEKIQAELASYKSTQLNRIESNIYEILARAAESVIGEAVNFDAHQDLIIKALEQAKRESMFI